MLPKIPPGLWCIHFSAIFITNCILRLSAKYICLLEAGGVGCFDSDFINLHNLPPSPRQTKISLSLSPPVPPPLTPFPRNRNFFLDPHVEYIWYIICINIKHREYLDKQIKLGLCFCGGNYFHSAWLQKKWKLNWGERLSEDVITACVNKIVFILISGFSP